MKGVESRQCLQTRKTRDEECYSSPGVPNPGTFLCNRKIVPRPLATTHNGSTLANENWSQSTLVLPLRRGLSPAGNRRSVTVEGVRSTAQQPTLFVATRTHTVIQGGKPRPAHQRNLKQKKRKSSDEGTTDPRERRTPPTLQSTGSEVHGTTAVVGALRCHPFVGQNYVLEGHIPGEVSLPCRDLRNAAEQGIGASDG